MKRLILLCLSVLLVSFPFLSFAGEWEIREDGYYYTHDEYKENRWLKEYGYWYYLGPGGKMLVGDVKGFFLNDGSYEDLPYGALVEDNPLVIDECKVDDISYLRIDREDSDYTKIIFMLHDLTGNKEDMLNYGTQLAAEKSLVFIPDIYAHGETGGQGTLTDIINNTSKSIDVILQEEDLLDDDILIYGYSVGGMIGADYVVSGEHKVDKLVMLASMPDISCLTDKRFYKVYTDGKVTGEVSRVLLKDKFIENSAFININAFKGTKIFMLNNINDDVISYQNVLESVNRLNAVTDVKYIGRDVKGHEVGKQDYLEAIMYIQGWR